jgi:hypothetical protein
MSEDESDSGDDDIELPATDTERPRGALTKTDRELLLGTKEYEKGQQRRNAWYRLRQHIRESQLDIHLIATHCPQDQLLKIQQQLENEHGELAMRTSGNLFHLGFRMLYNTVESDIYDDEFWESLDTGDDESVLEYWLSNELRSAMIRGLRNIDQDVSVNKIEIDVSIEKSKFDEEELLEELVFGRPTLETVNSYTSRGDVEKLQQKLREHDEVIEPTDHDFVFGPGDRIITERIPDDSN